MERYSVFILMSDPVKRLKRSLAYGRKVIQPILSSIFLCMEDDMDWEWLRQELEGLHQHISSPDYISVDSDDEEIMSTPPTLPVVPDPPAEEQTQRVDWDTPPA